MLTVLPLTLSSLHSAFWHFDDFSWGATRVIQGDKGGNHGESEGKFDPSNIVMKRWAEFERERRWRSGTHSRDSTYDVVQRSGSPERQGSTRYSVVSSDTFHSNPSTAQHDAMFGRTASAGLLAGPALSSGHGQDGSEQGHAKNLSSARARLDSVPLLELPAPLGPDASTGKSRSGNSPPGSVLVPRPRDLSPATSQQSHSSAATPAMMASSSSHSSRAPHAGYDSYPANLNEYPDEENRPMINSGNSSPDPDNRQLQPQSGADVRHGRVSSEQRYPGINEAGFTQAYSAEPDEYAGQHRPAPATPAGAPQRGFSLVDDGPVATPGGVRQVTRGARRMSAQSPVSPVGGSVAGSSARDRFSRPGPASAAGHATHESVSGTQLPPGAAPPRPPGYDQQ